ncbi:MAG: M15 family metallopeptidase, partial [Acutalibacteraceae bacterium]
TSKNNQSKTDTSKPQMVKRGEYELDAAYTNLFLVNGKNPLPENYEYGKNLITIESKYKNGQLDQIDKDIWPYMKAMIEAAWADNVDLKVWSPYRSYETQKMLFENQVNRNLNKGLSRAEAEAQAATVVARPGTSEHHTGLAADFNMASDAFENTKMYEWLKENAADYGFVMRYAKEKQPITGVILESWHWRFVGINAAKEMNELNMCLEEYVEHLKNKN